MQTYQGVKIKINPKIERTPIKSLRSTGRAWCIES